MNPFLSFLLESPSLLYPASILIAYGGYAVLLTNLQLGNLIPRFRSTIISLYCGAYDSSAFVLVFVKVQTKSTKFLFCFVVHLCCHYFCSCVMTLAWKYDSCSLQSLLSFQLLLSAHFGSCQNTAFHFRFLTNTTSTSAAGQKKLR